MKRIPDEVIDAFEAGDAEKLKKLSRKVKELWGVKLM